MADQTSMGTATIAAPPAQQGASVETKPPPRSIIRRGGAAFFGIVTLRRLRDADWEHFLVHWGPRSSWILAAVMVFIAFFRHVFVEPFINALGVKTDNDEIILAILFVLGVFGAVGYYTVQMGQVAARNISDVRGKNRDDTLSWIPAWTFVLIVFFMFVVAGFNAAGKELDVWWFVTWRDWPELLFLFCFALLARLEIPITNWLHVRMTARFFGTGDAGIVSDHTHAHATGDDQKQ